MKISVALCTYNGERFLKEQINSILNQSVPVDEIVVCDDCSSDATKNILAEYAANHPNLFRLYFNEENLRSNKNFEKAITLTTGDYIFLSDQDDCWRKDKVEKIIAIFENEPSVEGVFSDASFMDENGATILNQVSLWQSVCFFKESILEPSDLQKSLLNISNFLTGATLCIKKEVKEFSIPFLTTKNFIHDEWFAFVLTERNTLRFSTEKLISYRLHSGQQLGVGKIANPNNVVANNRRINQIMMGIKKPSNFKDCKSKVRFHFSQYEKYNDLYKQYNLPKFKIILDEMKEKFIAADNEMRQKFPIRYIFRKMSDKRKGKRQL